MVDRRTENGQNRRLSGGFTLIEVLVVIAIIGLLVGLLLPAVQSARESARRAQCVSNLHQIGIAMNAYHTVHNMFPPGFMWSKVGVVDNYSEITFILPQLDQGLLFNSINFDFNTVETPESPTIENHTARNTRISVFLCPSDGESRHLNSYRFNRGRFMIPGHSIFDGPFTFHVFPSVASVTDGLSNTAFVSERIGGSFGSGFNGYPRDDRWPSVLIMNYGDEKYIPECLACQDFTWQVEAGRYWMLAGFFNANYNHNGRPNDPRPDCGPGKTNFGFGLFAPRSYHPGIVNILMGDGRVISATNGINPTVWIAMGTFNAGDF